MAKRVKFDWSMLTRSNLTEFMWLLAPNIVNTSLKVTQFHSLVSSHIKKHLPVCVEKIANPKADVGYMLLGGSYYSDKDKRHEKPIHVLFAYNPVSKRLCLSRRKYERLCVLFADTILHEIIHARQYRRRRFKELPEYLSNASKTEQREEQSYLGGSDELDAYSFNIACELNERFEGNIKKITNYLSKNGRRTRKADCWKMYLKAFDYNHAHPIIRRVKKKVIRYIPFAELGKPYKNKDWIDH